MKLRIIYIRQILLTLFLMICYQHVVFSQETDVVTVKKPGLFFGINLGPSQSDIKNVGTLSVSGLLSNKKITFFGSVEVGYFFSDYFGLSSGIGFNSFSSQLTLATYQNKFNTIDSDKEPYELRVSGSGINELQKVNFLSIPFCINLRLPFNEKSGFFLQTGVKMAVPISKNYKSSGTFTYKGYYSAYNVLLENLPAYGFPTNKSIETDGELELKPFGFNATASAGFDFFIMNNIQIAIAACYDRSLSGISNYSLPDNFQLSSDPEKINSLMGGSSKATVQAIGLKIALRYYLKLKKVESL
jgi:hypothetical protein